MKRTLKPAAKFMAKTAALKAGKTVIRNGGVASIALGAAFGLGYFSYTTLKKSR